MFVHCNQDQTMGITSTAYAVVERFILEIHVS
jgi:hypothetical protein